MTDPCADREFLVLVVGNEPAAVRLIEEAFGDTGRPTGYVVATDGVEAFDALCGRGRHAGTRRPDLVLLDLDLPGGGGRALLAELKAHDDLRSLPVVVLANTDDADTIAECYRLGANAYVEKPMDYDGVLHVVGAVIDFWGVGAETPPRADVESR